MSLKIGASSALVLLSVGFGAFSAHAQVSGNIMGVCGVDYVCPGTPGSGGGRPGNPPQTQPNPPQYDPYRPSPQQPQPPVYQPNPGPSHPHPGHGHHHPRPGYPHPGYRPEPPRPYPQPVYPNYPTYPSNPYPSYPSNPYPSYPTYPSNPYPSYPSVPSQLDFPIYRTFGAYMNVDLLSLTNILGYRNSVLVAITVKAEARRYGSVTANLVVNGIRQGTLVFDSYGSSQTVYLNAYIASIRSLYITANDDFVLDNISVQLR